LDLIFKRCGSGAGRVKLKDKNKVMMDLIPFDEAYRIVMNAAFETGNEAVSFTASSGRVLMADIRSDINMPPFNKSTVDGFACRREDLGTELELIETIPAGYQPERTVLKNQCSKIMTGAVVPEGADKVFMVEDSAILSSGKVRFTGSLSKGNISFMGEDIRIGDVILEKGTFIKPQHIAIMASVGSTNVTVSKQPVVSVISSGSELVEPGQMPGRSQIRNTNSYQLMAQVSRAGAEGSYLGIARDDEDITLEIINRAIAQSDIVLITGGVSMGDFDFVPSVLERAGVRILFSRVNIQPGKPTTFGIHKKALIFGLPGNPVSSFLQFELLVRPLICKMSGYKWEPVIISVPMERAFSRKSADKIVLIPVRITDEGTAVPLEYHGSAHIAAFSEAFGVLTLPEGKSSVEKGEMVSVRQI
jgi:molybdopterin molybdotransferase